MGKEEALDRLEMAGDMVSSSFADFGVKLATAESSYDRLTVFEDFIEVMKMVMDAFIAVRDELRKELNEQ